MAHWVQEQARHVPGVTVTTLTLQLLLPAVTSEATEAAGCCTKDV